jgi:CreA protein
MHAPGDWIVEGANKIVVGWPLLLRRAAVGGLTAHLQCCGIWEAEVLALRCSCGTREAILRRLRLILGSAVLLIVVLSGVWILSRSERGATGSVNTKFRLFGPDDKIVVDGFDDPKVEGVACHISRAQTGGMKGAFGVAEDTSDASIACRQIGPIKIIGDIKDGERVFDERRSLIFKTLQVVRFFDRKRNVLVYVAYSNRFIEGSPKNSISSVPIMAWPEQ